MGVWLHAFILDTYSDVCLRYFCVPLRVGLFIFAFNQHSCCYCIMAGHDIPLTTALIVLASMHIFTWCIPNAAAATDIERKLIMN